MEVVTSELEALRKCSCVIYCQTPLKDRLLNSIDLNQKLEKYE